MPGQIQIAPLVQLDLYRIHPVMPGETPDGPASRVPLVQPHLEAVPGERVGQQSYGNGLRGAAVPVAKDHVGVQRHPEAVQVEQQQPGEPAQQSLDDRIEGPVERLMSQPDPVADLLRRQGPAVDVAAVRHLPADDAGGEPAVLLARRVSIHVGDEAAEGCRDRGDAEVGQKRVQLAGEPVRPQDVRADREIARQLRRIVPAAVRQAGHDRDRRGGRGQHPAAFRGGIGRKLHRRHPSNAAGRPGALVFSRAVRKG